MKRWLVILLTGLLLTACGSSVTSVNPDEFNMLKKGMSFDDVKKTVGGKPEKENEISNSIIEYRYKGEEGISDKSRVTLIFVNEKLDTIIETGLITEEIEPTQSEIDQADKNIEKSKELSLEERITKQIDEILGKKTNTEKKRLVELEINDHAGTEIEGDKIILLTLAGDENLSSKMTNKGMLIDSGKVFQEVFKNEEVQEVALFWQFPLVDTYGKTSDENVIKITLTRETFDKVEWKSFDYNNFDIVADNYWMHQALKE